MVIARRVTFTLKAEDEMEADGLTKVMVYEAILNAVNIFKTLRSCRPGGGARETLYVIKGLTFDGFAIYTKGAIRPEGTTFAFYVLVSSKRDTDA